MKMTGSRMERLEALLKENPKDAFSLFALAKEQERAGMASKALLSYERLLQADPDYLGAYYHYGKLLESVDAEKQALAIYRKGKEKAAELKDLHTLAELQNALQNLLLELDEEE